MPGTLTIDIPATFQAVILMASGFVRDRRLWLVSLACGAGTVAAQFLAHRLILGNDQIAYIGAFNTSVRILAMVLAT